MKKLISSFLVLAFLLSMMIKAESALAKKATVYHQIRLDKKIVNVGDPGAFAGGYKLLTAQKFGAKVFRPSSFSTTLSSNLAEEGSEATLKVNSITLKDGTALDDTNYGAFLILTVGSGDGEEKIAVGALNPTTKTFTIISRGLEYGRWASTTANMHQHLPGERVFVSDDDHFIYQKYADLENTETFTGRKTFSLSPILPTPSSSDLTYGANVEYVNNVATSGAANMSETIKGLSEGATRSEMASGTSIGDTGAFLVLQSRYATSTSQVATTSAVITKSNGKIDPSFLSGSGENYSFSGSTTLASTSFTQFPTSPNSYPTASTSLANKGYVDLTSALFSSGTWASNTPAIGSVNIAHGLGYTPRMVKITAMHSSGAGTNSTPSTSFGTLVGGTNYYVRHNADSAGTPASTQSSGSIIYLTTGTDNAIASATANSTNIVLTFSTFSGTRGVNILWEAYK